MIPPWASGQYIPQATWRSRLPAAFKLFCDGGITKSDRGSDEPSPFAKYRQQKYRAKAQFDVLLGFIGIDKGQWLSQRLTG